MIMGVLIVKNILNPHLMAKKTRMHHSLVDIWERQQAVLVIMRLRVRVWHTLILQQARANYGLGALCGSLGRAVPRMYFHFHTASNIS